MHCTYLMRFNIYTYKFIVQLLKQIMVADACARQWRKYNFLQETINYKCKRLAQHPACEHNMAAFTFQSELILMTLSKVNSATIKPERFNVVHINSLYENESEFIKMKSGCSSQSNSMSWVRQLVLQKRVPCKYLRSLPEVLTR